MSKGKLGCLSTLIIGILAVVGVAFGFSPSPKIDSTESKSEYEAKTSSPHISENKVDDGKKENHLSPQNLSVNPPQKKVIQTGEKAPIEVYNTAFRFHWLLYLSGPEVTTEIINSELKKVTSSKLMRKIEENINVDRNTEQKWGSIMVSAVRKHGDAWMMNTVAIIDDQQTTLYLEIKKGEYKWKVMRISDDPHLD